MADERRKHLLRDDDPVAGLCATAHLEVMVHGDCFLTRVAANVTCPECVDVVTPPGQAATQ